MRDINWNQVLVFGLAALVVFVLGLGLLLVLFGGRFSVLGGGMMGPRGMRGGWCPWCGGTGRLGSSLLGSILVLTLACLLPLGLLALLIIGGLWLARNAASSTSEAAAMRCSACGRPVEPDWRSCPYCGEDLQHE